MNSILITGGNRGLGLGLVKTLIRQQVLQKTQVIATYRLPEKSEMALCTSGSRARCFDPRNKRDNRNVNISQELFALAKQNANVVPVLADVTNLERYEQLVNEVESIVKDKGLNVLFNNAGISPKSTRLSFTKADDLVDTFVTNTVAPIILTKELLPLLKRAADRQPDAPLGPGRACVVNMSSILGSIAENREGGLYAYRTSKAALNAATKSMSLDLRPSGIMAVALHPGWVKTDMGGSKAPLSVDESCDAIVRTLLSLNESHNGGFLQYDGKTLPW